MNFNYRVDWFQIDHTHRRRYFDDYEQARRYALAVVRIPNVADAFILQLADPQYSSYEVIEQIL